MKDLPEFFGTLVFIGLVFGVLLVVIDMVVKFYQIHAAVTKREEEEENDNKK